VISRSDDAAMERADRVPKRRSMRRLLLSTAPFLLVLVLALIVRLLYWSDARGYTISWDEPDYVLPAQTLLREGHYLDNFISINRTWTRVPLTSIFFAGVFLLTPDSRAATAAADDPALMQPRYDAITLAQIGLTLITIVLIMLLAARIFPGKARRVALVAGFIAALYPPLASIAAQRPLSDPLALTLSWAALYTLSWWSPGKPVQDRVALALGAGALFGLASLARPVAFAFLPFACLWLLLCYRAYRNASTHVIESVGGGVKTNPLVKIKSWLMEHRKPLLSGVLIVVTCVLFIIPWTYYNYRQYGRFIFLDTASGFILWNSHNYRYEDTLQIAGTIDNPADRLSFTLRQLMENVVEYPDQALMSLPTGLGFFWHLELYSGALRNPWDMTQRDPEVTDLLHADVAFLLLGLASMTGLVAAGRGRLSSTAGRTLLLLQMWLLMSVLLSLSIPYYEARHRLQSAPVLIILASGLLVLADWRVIFSPARAWATLRRHVRSVMIALVLCLWVLLGAYFPELPPMLRSLYQSWRGDLALASGDVSTAFGRYELAKQEYADFHYPVRHAADVARRLGRDDEARRLYNEAREIYPEDPYGMLGFADLVARHPEWKLTIEERGWLQPDENEWRGNPWNSFQPSPIAHIDVGSGADVGYIRGFYQYDRPSPDQNYRWSRGRSTVRIPLPPDGSYSSITLRMSAPAVGPPEPMSVSISVNGAAPTRLDVPVGWADYKVPMPPDGTSPGKTLILEIESSTRNPRQFDPTSIEKRDLGVGIDLITLTD